MMISSIIFYIFSILSVIFAILMITFRNPVKSALSMISCIFCIAILYFLLEAHFVGIIQILIYAGAIMVLFLFVILLLEKSQYENTTEFNELKFLKLIPILFFILFAIISSIGLILTNKSTKLINPNLSESFGTIKSLANVIFYKYGITFEALSILILIAIVSIIYLSKKSGETNGN